MEKNKSLEGLFYKSFLAIIAVTAVLTVYSHTLTGPFVLDDIVNIIQNQYIRMEEFSFKSILNVLTAPHPIDTRKIAYLTFAFNFLAGEYNPFGYHLVNILIHLGNVILIAVFVLLSLKNSWLTSSHKNVDYWIAWTTAIMWGLHPLQINAVTYIVQRMTSLAVFFGLLALISWIIGRTFWKRRKPYSAGICWMGGLVCWVLGLMCKEHIAVLPLLIVVHEFFLFKRGELPIKKMYVFTAVAIGLLFILIYQGPEVLSKIKSLYDTRDFTLQERVMTQARILWYYLSLFFFPVADRFALFYEYPISRGLFTPLSTFFSIILWICCISIAWLKRKDWPLFSWMVFWFISAHLIESTIIPLEMVFEHRMYLPSIGLSMGIIVSLSRVITAKQYNPKIFILILAMLISIFGSATYIRNMDFKDPITMHLSDLQKYPDSKRIRLNLAIEMSKARMFVEAESLHRGLVRDFPTSILILKNWFTFLFDYQQFQEAENVYQQILDLIREGKFRESDDGIALWNMAQDLYSIEQYERALLIADSLLSQYVEKTHIMWFFKGSCHYRLQQWDKAASAFEEALKRKPNDPATLNMYEKAVNQKTEHEKDRASQPS